MYLNLEWKNKWQIKSVNLNLWCHKFEEKKTNCIWYMELILNQMFWGESDSDLDVSKSLKGTVQWRKLIEKSIDHWYKSGTLIWSKGRERKWKTLSAHRSTITQQTNESNTVLFCLDWEKWRWYMYSIKEDYLVKSHNNKVIVYFYQNHSIQCYTMML